MTTITLPPQLASRMIESWQVEHAAEQDAERAAALSDLQALQAQWQQSIPPLDKAMSAAETRLQAARKEVAAATAALASAEGDRRAAATQIDRQADAIRYRLSGDLRHPLVQTALDQLDQIEDDTRNAPAPEIDPAVVGDRLVTARAAKISRSITSRLAWIRDIGRPAVQELQFVASDDLAGAIEKVMAGLPAIG